MHPYDIEILMKQRQMELDEELKRIYLLRTVKEPGTGLLKRSKLGFGKVLIAMGTRLKKRFRLYNKPSISGHDSCSP